MMFWGSTTANSRELECLRLFDCRKKTFLIKRNILLKAQCTLDILACQMVVGVATRKNLILVTILILVILVTILILVIMVNSLKNHL